MAGRQSLENKVMPFNKALQPKANPLRGLPAAALRRGFSGGTQAVEKIAVVQESPVFLDRKRTIDKAVALVHRAANSDANLVVFPEAFISGYPAWIWRLRPGGDWGKCEVLHQRMVESAVKMDRDDLLPLLSAARESSLSVVCGINELDGQTSGATLYNSVVVIDSNGNVVNHHRKLMPTNPERMVWGFGDGSGLKVVQTSSGKVGTLICWENYMPLARYSLYAQGVEMYVAPTYDSGEGWLGSMQHIAREGRCWVINCGVALENSDIPDDFPDRDALYPQSEAWINPGDSAVIAPGGEIVAGPLHEEKGIVYAEVDIAKAILAKRALDVTGHYSRPDVFSLEVNRSKQSPIAFIDRDET
jgi:nitrilase